jgi:acyl-CoA synthetase (NDP forming)/GNAT superfamily N-acetyltransferase
MTTPAFDAITADGGIVRIRPATAEDAAGLRRLHLTASEESLYRRFFVGGHAGVDAEVARLIRPAAPDHITLVAQEGDEIVGVGSVERGVPTSSSGEFALIVGDSDHGRGIGTLLLETLAALARQAGVTELVGDVLPTNTPMVHLARDLGTQEHVSFQDGVVVVRLTTADTDTTALDARDRQAARRSLAPLLAPRSVAVIGAGRQPGGVGHAVLANLVAGGYTGVLYAIHPSADAIAGVPAYPSVEKTPGPVDLAVIAVPAASVAGVLQQCGTAGVRAAVIITAGFGETGPAGREVQAELVRIARHHGIRLVGPNCLGILNTDESLRLYATFAAVEPEPGGLAVASQSGAVAITILDHVQRSGTGLSSFVSLGNKADVSGNDLLAYWYDDPATRAVALYLESVGNPRRFARIARALGRRKPVLAVKSGRSAAGQRAGASHTAAAAAPDATVDALFAQSGVVRCDSLGELLDAARLLVDQPLPAGPRVGVVGNAGGVNVMIVDAAEANDLTVAVLPSEVQAMLAVTAPAAASVANPIDLGAAATPDAFRATITELAASSTVDSIVAVFALTGANDVTGVLDALREAVDEVSLPVCVVLLGLPDPPSVVGNRRAPVYDLPEQAVSAIARAAGYARWRATPAGSRPQLSDVDSSGARRTADRALQARPGWQPPEVAAALLSSYGIPLAPGRVVRSAADAIEAAGRLGYPVVLKAADPDLVHKSDIGAVKLNLADPAAVADAYPAIAAALGQLHPPVLVQHMGERGIELVAGIVHDPVFGSVVMLGLGGVHTDIFGDRALRLLPVTDTDAAAMWRSLRAAPLLTGYRGQPAVDTAAVEDLVERLGRLAEDLPELAELDLNPVLAGPHGLVAVDVKLRLAPVGFEPDAALRTLRQPG